MAIAARSARRVARLGRHRGGVSRIIPLREWNTAPGAGPGSPPPRSAPPSGLAITMWSSVVNALLYFPTRTLDGTPASVGLRYSDLDIPTSDGQRLHGWWIPSPRRPVVAHVLFFHGNGGNISHRLVQARALADAGLDVLLFDYRGYGRSTGTPDEAGTYRDARAARAALLAQPGIDAAAILYLGESLGGAVATELALAEPPAGLVLQSTFTSVREMARLHYPVVPAALVPDAYPTLERIARVRCPVLILHGDRDDIVPARPRPGPVRGGHRQQASGDRARGGPQRLRHGRGGRVRRDDRRLGARGGRLAPFRRAAMIRPYKGIWPKLGERVYVDASAQVIGDVELGDHASVWMNAVIRGDVHSIRIGAHSNIQDSCVVHVFKDQHPTVLADHVTVGHSVTLHGCRIDSYCLIGMGATILNGAHVGRGVASSPRAR